MWLTNNDYESIDGWWWNLMLFNDKIDWLILCSENSSGVSFLQVQLEHSKKDILLGKRERGSCIPIVFLNVHVFGYCILNQNKKAILANNTVCVSYCTWKFLFNISYNKIYIEKWTANTWYPNPAIFYPCFTCSSFPAADGKSVSLCNPLYTPAAIIPPIMGAIQ